MGNCFDFLNKKVLKSHTNAPSCFGLIDVTVSVSEKEQPVNIWFCSDMGATPFSEQDLFLNLNFFQRSYRLFY